VREIGLGKTQHTQVASYKSRIRWFHEWIHTLEYRTVLYKMVGRGSAHAHMHLYVVRTSVLRTGVTCNSHILVNTYVEGMEPILQIKT
jgi:GrpB-like predicted nucleotidyltransferase (UPF0157 family)